MLGETQSALPAKSVWRLAESPEHPQRVQHSHSSSWGLNQAKVFLHQLEHYIKKCRGNHLAWRASEFSTGENSVKGASGSRTRRVLTERGAHVSCTPLLRVCGAVFKELKHPQVVDCREKQVCCTQVVTLDCWISLS